MSDKKIYSIQIDGVQQSYDSVIKLSDAVKQLTLSEGDEKKAQIAATQAKREANSILQQEVKLMSSAEGSIKQLQAQLSLLRKDYDNLSKSERDNAQVGGELLKSIQLLDNELKVAKEATGRFQESVGNYATAAKGMKSELKDLEGQLAAMLQNGVKPTDEAFIELASRAGELKDAIGDAKGAVSLFASDSRKLDQVIDIGQSLTAVFGTATGVMSMFGVDSEKAAQQIQKLQGAMTVLTSLQQLQNNITKQGTLTNTLYTKSVALLSTTWKSMTGAINGSTTAVNGFKAALVATGIGALIVGIGLLVANWDKLSAALGFAEEKQTDYNAALEKLIQYQQDVMFYNDMEIEIMEAQGKSQDEIFKKRVENAQELEDTARREWVALDNLTKKTDEQKEAEKKAFDNFKQLSNQRQKIENTYRAYSIKSERDKTKEEEDLRKKNAESWKKQQDERNGNLKSYLKNYESYVDGIKKLELDNERAVYERIIKEAKNVDQLKLGYQKYLEFTDKRYEEEKLLAEKNYEELKLEAEKNNQDTTKLLENYNNLKLELDKKYQSDRLSIQTEGNNAITNKMINDSQKIIDEETRLLDDRFNSIKDASKKYDTENDKNGILGLPSVEKMKDYYKENNRLLFDYLINLESSTKKISDGYDKQIEAAGDDTDKIKDLTEKKKALWDDYEAKATGVMNSIDENTKSSNNAQQDYFKALAENVAKYTEIAMTAVNGIFEIMNSLTEMQLEEAKERLDEISEQYDEVVQKQEDSNNRIKELQEEAKTAQGGRAVVVQEEIAREMDANSQLANQEKKLRKEKEKAEKDVEKKEKQMKKQQLAQSLVQGIANTAMGVTQALGSYPPPISFVMAALVGALGAVNTGIIATQMSKLEDGGVIGSDGNGKLHSQGGHRIEGTNIEVEKGEWVINRESSMKYNTLLEAINNDTLGNQINQFTPVNQESLIVDSSENNIANAIAEMNIQVAVTDIADVNSKMVNVKELAGSSL